MVGQSYGGEAILELDAGQAGPGGEGGTAGGVRLGEEHRPEVLLAVEAEHERLEVLVHEAVQGADVVAAKDLGERYRVPALEQLPLLLEHVVVQVRVRRHHHRPPDDACLEDGTVPTYTSINFPLSIILTDMQCDDACGDLLAIGFGVLTVASYVCESVV